MPQASGTAEWFTSVYFTDSQAGWAVIEVSGTIELRTDGRRRRDWQAPSGTLACLSAIHFADAQRGWVVGGFGTILHTSDGGLSWQQQAPSGMYHGLLSVYFTDNQRGWAVGEAGYDQPRQQTVDGIAGRN